MHNQVVAGSYHKKFNLLDHTKEVGYGQDKVTCHQGVTATFQ